MSASADMRDRVLRWHARGYDVTSTARLLGLSEAEVCDIITHPEPVKPSHNSSGPEFWSRCSTKKITPRG